MKNPTVNTVTMNYDQALEVFLETDASYGGGLSNHGPMAAEALVSLDVEEALGPFVEHYRTRLEPQRHEVPAAPEEWESWLRFQLTDLVDRAGNLAGHGLLRVAHAVRGLERTTSHGGPTPAQLRELATAVDYWRRGGPGIAGPSVLHGPTPAGAWAAGLDRLPADERAAGMLTVTLGRAAATDDFAERVAALAPAPDAGATLDALATAAAEAFMRNEGIAAFALLHGVTVSSMARVLLAHLDDADGRRLDSAVASFVAAAVMGFDDGSAAMAADDGADLPDPPRLAAMAAATREDHTIKFADACIGVAARTGAAGPLRALHRQITTPYGQEP